MHKSTDQAGAVAMATCPICATQFDNYRYGKPGRRRKYCSGACAKEGNRRYSASWWAKNGKQYRRAAIPDAQAICHQCQQSYSAFPSDLRRGRKYCSAACRDAARRAKPKRRVSITCEQCGTVFEVYPARAAAKYCSRECTDAAFGRAPVEEIPCPVCGEPFKPVSKGRGRSPRKYCSRHCYHIGGTDYDTGLEWAEPDDDTARECRECGVEFVQSEGSNRVGFCSAECLRRRRDRMHSATRRWRIRRHEADGSIDPIEVFERAGWRCEWCGVKTPQSHRGTMKPTAPELDHIIPLARGGAHVWTNVQCLCRACNRAKFTEPMGQLRFA